VCLAILGEKGEGGGLAIDPDEIRTSDCDEMSLTVKRFKDLAWPEERSVRRMEERAIFASSRAN